MSCFTTSAGAARDKFVQWVANLSLAAEDPDLKRELDTAILDEIVRQARSLCMEDGRHER